MDKQNTPPTKYVRITKCRYTEDCWYYNRIGDIFPIDRVTSDGCHYPIYKEDKEGLKHYIAESDCEPYEFPELETMEDRELAWAQYETTKGAFGHYMQNEFKNIPYYTSPQDLAKKAFEAGAMWGLGQAHVQEGHTIPDEQLTEDQVKTLKRVYYDLENEECRGALQDLRRSFPTVFKPERIYQPGTRFIVGDDELMLTKTGELWRMVDLNTGKGANRSIRYDFSKEALKDDDIDTLLDGAAFDLMD